MWGSVLPKGAGRSVHCDGPLNSLLVASSLGLNFKYLQREPVCGGGCIVQTTRRGEEVAVCLPNFTCPQSVHRGIA